MNAKTNPASSKEQVLAAFQQVMQRHKALANRIATKEEEAARANERRLVQTASGHSVESIVKGLAELQLIFGNTVEGLSARLADESQRLEELRQAITIETAYVKQLEELKVAADALNILEQEHREALRACEEGARQRLEALESEAARTRAAWAEEQRLFEAAVHERNARLAEARQKAEADAAYELERKRKLTADGFAEKQRVQQRETVEADAAKARAWAERERTLAARQAEFEQKKARLDAFSSELEAEVKKAREEAIREAAAEARVKAELMEKEIEANRKVHALQIATLEETITKNAAQLEALTQQLQAALKQTQDLALRAIDGAAATTHTKPQAQA